MKVQPRRFQLFIALLLCELLLCWKAASAVPQAAQVAEPTRAVEARTINPKDVADLVARQTSYQMSLLTQSSESTTNTQITIVREPASEHVRFIERGAVLAHYIKIGEREWVALGTNPDPETWQEAADAKGDVILGKVYSDFLDLVQKLHPLIFFYNLDREASLTRPALDMDGTTCDEYTWTEGEVAGSICLSTESGLPVSANFNSASATIEARYSHFNNPANSIPAPLTDFPQRLHIDDARMALNSLSSFQWTASLRWEPRAGAQSEEFFYIWQGTYVLANQAWRAFLWANTEETDNPPALKVMQIGEQRWVGVDGEQDPWTRVPPGVEDTLIEDSNPFNIWRSWLNPRQPGDLAATEVITLNDQSCHEYRFTLERTNDQGQLVRQEIRLFVATDSSLPMRVESVVTTPTGTLTSTWELSHIDHPTNLVEMPS